MLAGTVPVTGWGNAVTVGYGVVAGVFLVTRLLLLWRFPPFLDESLYATWAQAANDDNGQRFLALANGKLPLLPWLGAPLIWLGVEPITAVRLVSLGCGLAALALAGALGNRLAGPWGGVAAAGAYALLPYALVHDVLGLMEPLVAATALAALYLQVRLADRPRLDFALLLGLVLGAGILTKESGAIALVLVPFSLLVFHWHTPGARRRLAAWVGCMAASLAVAGLCYSVLSLSDYWDDYAGARRSLGTWRSFTEGISHPLRWLDDAWPGYRDLVLGYVTWPVLLVLALGVVVALLERPRLALLYLIWGLAPVAAAVLFLTEEFARYLLPALPLVAIFVGAGAVRLGHPRAFQPPRPLSC
jgi:4-amino-4-deoxy-L-arabinose transferase-like glycosyltransferase